MSSSPVSLSPYLNSKDLSWRAYDYRSCVRDRLLSCMLVVLCYSSQREMDLPPLWILDLDSLLEVRLPNNEIKNKSFDYGRNIPVTKFFAEMSRLVLVFDVDGTLTPARRKISPEMREYIKSVRDKGIPVVVVGGSDINKITEQLADNLNDLLGMFDYVFSENGLVGYKGTTAYPSQSIQAHVGEEKLQKLINFVLRYFSDLSLPVKRGNFVEFRKGMINFSPIGRSCSLEERENFVEYDKEHKVRENFVKVLQENFAQYGLAIAIGGQISVDVYPNGWDKTFCLQYFEKEFDQIHFFGDKTMPGGNDHEIFIDPRVTGHTVSDPEDTRKQVEEVLSGL